MFWIIKNRFQRLVQKGGAWFDVAYSTKKLGHRISLPLLLLIKLHTSHKIIKRKNGKSLIIWVIFFLFLQTKFFPSVCLVPAWLFCFFGFSLHSVFKQVSIFKYCMTLPDCRFTKKNSFHKDPMELITFKKSILLCNWFLESSIQFERIKEFKIFNKILSHYHWRWVRGLSHEIGSGHV